MQNVIYLVIYLVRSHQVGGALKSTLHNTAEDHRVSRNDP